MLEAEEEEEGEEETVSPHLLPGNREGWWNVLETTSGPDGVETLHTRPQQLDRTGHNLNNSESGTSVYYRLL